MENIKVSVIIPVYNVEYYLKECLDSVINQTLKEIEIICIDDCSTDNSSKILEEYAKKDNRIKLIKNEENKNIGYSRNIGQKKAIGEYLYFMDSDDYIALDFLELMYNTAKKYDCDMVSSNNTYKDENGKISAYYVNINNFITETNKYPIDYKANIDVTSFNRDKGDKRIIYELWSKLFKRSFVVEKNIYAPENKVGSSYDIYFIIKIILNNPIFAFNTKAKFYYRIRNTSITYSVRNDLKKNLYNIENCKKIEEYCKTINKNELNNLYPHLWHIIMYPFMLSSNDNDKKGIYNDIYNYTKQINLIESLISEKDDYAEYLLIKSNDTYEKYVLQKELFESINNIKNKLNQLDSKVNKIIEKQNSKTKLFGIDNLKDRKIIYIFGIKITIKK